VDAVQKAGLAGMAYVRSHEWSSEDFAADPPGLILQQHGRGWFRTSDLSRVKRALSH
jgi:hypothetical protein